MPDGGYLADLTGGKEQFRTGRRKSVRFYILQGWIVTCIPALIFGGIVEIGCLYFVDAVPLVERLNPGFVRIGQELGVEIHRPVCEFLLCRYYTGMQEDLICWIRLGICYCSSRSR